MWLDIVFNDQRSPEAVGKAVNLREGGQRLFGEGRGMEGPEGEQREREKSLCVPRADTFLGRERWSQAEGDGGPFD